MSYIDDLKCLIFGHKWENRRTTLNPETRCYQDIQTCSRCYRYQYIEGTQKPIKNDLKEHYSTRYE